MIQDKINSNTDGFDVYCLINILHLVISGNPLDTFIMIYLQDLYTTDPQKYQDILNVQGKVYNLLLPSYIKNKLISDIYEDVGYDANNLVYKQTRRVFNTTKEYNPYQLYKSERWNEYILSDLKSNKQEPHKHDNDNYKFRDTYYQKLKSNEPISNILGIPTEQDDPCVLHLNDDGFGTSEPD